MAASRPGGFTTAAAALALAGLLGASDHAAAQGAVRSVHADWQVRCETPPGAQGEHQPDHAALSRYGVNETQALDFHTPYGCSKGAADQYVLDYARSFGATKAVLARRLAAEFFVSFEAMRWRLTELGIYHTPAEAVIESK